MMHGSCLTGVKQIDHLLSSNIVTDSLVEMLELQREFVVEKKTPGYIDIGYHYTNPENIPSILRSGLLSKDDRTIEKIAASRNHGSVFGNGCYTGNNPYDFSRYGDTCLLVARLQGSTARVPKYLPRNEEVIADTIIGNKIEHPIRIGQDGWPVSGYEVVLRSSSQCSSLIMFGKSLIKTKEGKQYIESMRNSLQVFFDRH